MATAIVGILIGLSVSAMAAVPMLVLMERDGLLAFTADNRAWGRECARIERAILAGDPTARAAYEGLMRTPIIGYGEREAELKEEARKVRAARRKVAATIEGA